MGGKDGSSHGGLLIGMNIYPNAITPLDHFETAIVELRLGPHPHLTGLHALVNHGGGPVGLQQGFTDDAVDASGLHVEVDTGGGHVYSPPLPGKNLRISSKT